MTVLLIPFINFLGELKGFVARHNYDHLLIAGNFNRNSVSVHHLRSFMSDLNLVSADLSYLSSIQFIYMRDDGTASSWCNHYLSVIYLLPVFSHICRFEFGSNLFDHFPLLCSLCIDLSEVFPTSPTSPTFSSDLAASYCSVLSSLLPPFPDSVHDCYDPSCT